MSQVIIRQNGPLPIKTSVMWPSSEPVIVAVSGSAWTQKPGSTVALQVMINGESIGTMQQYCNAGSSHAAIPSGYFAVQRQIEEVTVSLSAGNNTTMSDQNDYYTIALIF